MNRLKFYQRLALVSGLVLVLLNHFAFGFLGFFIPRAKAASVNWVGTSGGSWHDPANWSGGEVPTGLDEVTITGDDMFVLATTTIDFTSLTLAGPDVRFGLVGNIGTGGDITVSSSLLIQGNATRQTITGTLSLTNGGTLTHLQNTSTTLYTVDFVAEDVIIESGAQVRVDNEGNPGGGVGEDGYGDGGGDANTNGVHGGGASNAGMGGQSSDGNVGGNDTCTFSDLGPLYGGSGGAGSAASSGGDGGGFVRLEANNSIIVNGRITADADGSGSEIAGEGAGGGAGGTIHLVANTVSGIPELIAARGGNSFDSNGGGGGGGCVRIEYDTTTSISGAEIIVDGGVGFENGGAGLVLVEKIDESARHMYLTATTTAAYGASQMFGVADTNFEGFIDQVTTLSLSTTSRYVVTDSVGAETFSITSSSPFGMSSPSGTLQIGTGVNLRLVSGATIENATLELINDLPTSGQNRYVTVTEVGSSNPATFSIGANGVLVMNNFTTTTPLVLESFTVESGGLLTHTQNSASPEQTQMVHIQAEEITIESGGLVDVSGKGFSGGIDGEDGNGPGGGEFVDMFTGVGAGHGGDGAASDTSGNATGSGGSAYCDASNPRTLGSGGASGFHYEGAGVDGGFGGGLVWLVASSSLTLQGDIFADGTDGAFESFVGDVVFQSISGGGAGGGVKLYAPQIMGAGEIFARGGDNGVDSSPEPTEYGGGGGGCVLVNYVETNQVTSSSIYVAGGGLSDGVAEVGLSSVVKENEAPQLFLNIYPPSKVGEVADAVDLNEPLDVVVSSTFAYVVAYADNSMRVIDVSSSTDPQIVGGVKDDTDLFMPVSLAMSGQYVFVAAFGDNSMRVIDVSSSTDPQIVGGVKDDTDLAGIGSIEIVGQYAYVTGVSGDFFRIIDISDPLDPQILGGIVDPVSLNGARGIAISGNYAYVLSQFDSSLQVIDISDPDNPEIVGSVQDTLRLDNANALVASDGYVYVAGVDYDAVVIVDVSTPTNPEIVKSARGALRTDQPPFGSPNGLTISDNSLYVSHGGGHSGIAVFDISDPERTHIIGSYTQSTGLGFSYGIQVVDELAYITPYDSDSLVVFDISRSTSADPDISFYVYENDREPVFVKAEYRIGSCSVYEDTNYATFVSSTATSTYGISINNSAGDGRRIRDIEMSPSSDFPVSFATTTWLTSVDDAGAQEGNYCMFMTPYDGELEGERVEVEIVVDDPFTVPEIPVLSIFNKTQTSITLSWDVVGGVDHYIVSSTVTTTPTETTETSVTFAGLMSNTVYTFQIKAVDTFGNESAFSSAFEVETDEISSGGGGGGGGTAAPLPTTPSSTASSTYDNPSGLIRINDGAIYTRNRVVTVSFNTSFTDSYMLSEINDFSGKNYALITPTTDFTLSAGDGEKRIYARFANQFGIYEAYDIIILDTASPQVPTLVPLTMPELIRRVDGTYVRRNASSTVRLRPVLSGTAEPNSRIVITLSSGLSVVQSVRLAAVQTFYTTTNESGAWSFAFPLDLENTTYTLSVQAEDSAGNISMPTQTILNLSSATPPEEPPCTTGCEPVEEEPPVDEPPVCTVNCETEDIPENPPENVPEDSGDTSGETNTGEEGMGGGDESEGTAGGDTGSVEVGSSESAETPGNEEKTIQTVFSTASDSVAVVLGAVSGFAREVVEDVKNIPGVGRVVEVAEVVIQKTGEVIDNPVVEKTNQTYVAPALATAAVVNVAAGGVGLLSQVVMYLRLIFSQPLLLLRSKKQKHGEVVFNTYTKQPIDLALVRLLHDEKNNIIRTQVTDAKGRYFMVGGMGNYRLEADKEGFVLDATHGEDAHYTNVYAGGALALTAERNELNYNIPLQPADEKKTTEHILKEYGRVALRKTVSMVGAVATVVSFIISPNVWITGLLLAHIVLYRVMKRVAQKKVVGEYGVSVDADTNKKLEKVIIRVFEASYNKLVDTTITDAKGRYAILVGPGTYYLTAEKSGYELYKSENIDFSKERTNDVGGVIAENIVLKKSGSSLTPPEKEIRVRTMPMI